VPFYCELFVECDKFLLAGHLLETCV